MRSLRKSLKSSRKHSRSKKIKKVRGRVSKRKVRKNVSKRKVRKNVSRRTRRNKSRRNFRGGSPLFGRRSQQVGPAAPAAPAAPPAPAADPQQAPEPQMYKDEAFEQYGNILKAEAENKRSRAAVRVAELMNEMNEEEERTRAEEAVDRIKATTFQMKFKEANEHYKDFNIREALKLYQEAKSMYPDNDYPKGCPVEELHQMALDVKEKAPEDSMERNTYIRENESKRNLVNFIIDATASTKGYSFTEVDKEVLKYDLDGIEEEMNKIDACIESAQAMENLIVHREEAYSGYPAVEKLEVTDLVYLDEEDEDLANLRYRFKYDLGPYMVNSIDDEWPYKCTLKQHYKEKVMGRTEPEIIWEFPYNPLSRNIPRSFLRKATPKEKEIIFPIPTTRTVAPVED